MKHAVAAMPHRLPGTRGWIARSLAACTLLLAACSTESGVETEESFELPLFHSIDSGTRDARNASSTFVVHFHEDHLYTLSDRVQRWDWMTGAEVPLDGADTSENGPTGGGQLHFSSKDGLVGRSQGGRVYPGAATDQPLLTAEGTGYLNVTYVEGYDQFAAYDATALMFHDRATGKLALRMPVEAGITKAVGGKRSYVTALPDFRIVVWPVEPDGQGLVLSGHRGKVIEMVYSADETRLASADSTGLVLVWELAGGTEVQRFEIEVSQAVPAASLAFFPDGATLAGNGKGGDIHFWSVDTGERISTFRATHRGIIDIDISDDGTLLAVGTSWTGRYDKNRITAKENFFEDPNLLSSGGTLVFGVTSVPVARTPATNGADATPDASNGAEPQRPARKSDSRDPAPRAAEDPPRDEHGESAVGGRREARLE
ncbi:hypothetical protein Poly30_41740 [Planctomycetes bacterium Poly30]|uniref:Uncharacterized protein n=1 Tax=Saltatorellus ferox TaxID=2528018 RepID=A0A518EX32_9BACT|nr:hypothetical protein Poly30_41740 [Planctomycetes bacterium Poly30]